MDLAKGRLVPAEGPVIAALKLTLDFLWQILQLSNYTCLLGRRSEQLTTKVG